MDEGDITGRPVCAIKVGNYAAIGGREAEPGISRLVRHRYAIAVRGGGRLDLGREIGC